MPQASLDTTYRALADASRRAMLRQLARNRAQSVSELSAPLSLALPTVLKHIGVLVEAGLVERTKSGRVVTVTLRPQGMAEAMAWLAKTEEFWSSRLDRLSALVVKEAKEKR
jgi:DNA-binding transcriptional ArsR family regulator